VKKLIVLSIFAGITVFLYPGNACGDEIRILFTSNANGKIENCDCPDLPYGALEKRAQFIHEYREKYPDALVVDNGDNFLSYDTELKFPIIITAFQLSRYDVINLGDQDLAFAPDDYFEVKGVINRHGRALSLPKGGTSFSVLPVMHPSTRKFYPENTFANAQFSNPVVDIKEWLRTTQSREVFTVLLSHSGFQEDAAYAQAFPDINLIIGGHSQTRIDTLLTVNGVPIVQGGGNAQYVGEIRFVKEADRFNPVYYHLHPLRKEMANHPKMDALLESYHTKIPR